MLSVPPAFVLSQDQTLYYSCISRIFRFVEINPVHNACVITSCVLFFSLYLTSCFLQIFIQRNLKGRYFFLALFDFQDAALFTHCALLRHFWHPGFTQFFQVPLSLPLTDFSSRCDSYLIISQLLRFVNPFLKSFSKSFSLRRYTSLSCNFYIISHCLFFVKPFSEISFNSLRSAFRLCTFKRLPDAQIFRTHFTF